MKRAVNLLLAVGLSACFSPGSLTDEMPDDFPHGSCEDTDAEACASSSSSGSSAAGSSTSGGSSSTAAVSDDCQGADGCLGEDACVAEWDVQAQSRGPFVCRFACVPLLDESTWCSDDAACCDGSAQCTPRGYCIVPDSGDDSGDAGSESSSGGSTG